MGALLATLLLGLFSALRGAHSEAAGAADTIERVKQSIVAVGTYLPSRSPPFEFFGTGFVVGNGKLIATNAHVLPATLDPKRREALAIAVPSVQRDNRARILVAKQVAIDVARDMALLAIDGANLPSLALTDSSAVREGELLLFTGFPIGAVLGLAPTTHRAMVSAWTPIAIPSRKAGQLDARAIKELAAGPYLVMQLDAVAYPGNSGSPLYHPETGDVVGIVNMVLVKSAKEGALSQPSGITYAVPIQPLKELLRSLR